MEDDTDLISLLRKREEERKEGVGRRREGEKERACQGQLLRSRAGVSLDIVRPTNRVIVAAVSLFSFSK